MLDENERVEAEDNGQSGEDPESYKTHSGPSDLFGSQ
jgi:hypothetical protein